jgi:hypothetical protein
MALFGRVAGHSLPCDPKVVILRDFALEQRLQTAHSFVWQQMTSTRSCENIYLLKEFFILVTPDEVVRT